MNFAAVLANISNIIIPAVIFYVVAMGLVAKKKVYEDFVKGATDGFHTVIRIMPTLIGLMVAVGILRVSGFLDLISMLFRGFTDKMGLPAQLMPLIFIRMFSSSAATGFALDMFREYGTDSYIGTLTSLLLSCTETIFYTMSVYFIAAKVTKTRWTLPGALIATIAGIAASVLLAGVLT